MKLHSLTAAAACVWALALPGQAQTTPPASTYKYSANLSIAVPKGSAADGVSKDKSKPAAMRYSPCKNGLAHLDQFSFTVKYDAGKDAATMRNVYLIFNKDGNFFPLVRQGLTNSTNAFFAHRTRLDKNDIMQGIKATDTYTAAINNLGGVRTEVILGGDMPLGGLSLGLWTITAIVADPATVEFDKPDTWDAWDSVPFMLGRPWQGSLTPVCS